MSSLLGDGLINQIEMMDSNVEHLNVAVQSSKKGFPRRKRAAKTTISHPAEESTLRFKSKKLRTTIDLINDKAALHGENKTRSRFS